MGFLERFSNSFERPAVVEYRCEECGTRVDDAGGACPECGGSIDEAEQVVPAAYRWGGMW